MMKTETSRIRQIVNTTSNEVSILITGAPGSPKGLFARAIHAEMKKASKKSLPIIRVECGTLPESLANSALFGARKGTWTSQTEDMKGLAAAAEYGVLLLDNVHRLPMETHGALLGLLQERTYTRGGSTSEQQFFARVVSTTNVPLNEFYKRDPNFPGTL
jgi:transcriptional regulator with AAA-type ATPase domain